jgi:Tol biopolymer transport system component
MKKRYIVFIVALLITSCDILVNNDRDEPCPPTIGPGCNEVNFISIDTDAAWSTDGNTIAFFSSGNDGKDFGIYFINDDGSDRRLFHSGLAEAPAWSPDGQWIAFHQNAHIFKKHVETDSLVQLTLEGRNFHPDWSPDGELITYDRSIADDSGPSGIWIMNTDGSNRNFSFGGAFPVWHPKDNGILAVIGTSATSIWKIFLLHYYDGTREDSILEAVVEQENLYPKYSPCGSKIVFQSQPGPDSSVPPPWMPQIWIMNSDGSGLKQLTDTGGLKPAWSPDSQWIIYTETYETGRLWLMRPDGSDKHQLTSD